MAAPDPALAADLALMREAALAGGALVREGFGAKVKTWSKGAAGPVTEVDLAVDRLLHGALIGNRPSYGWLSEETPDAPERLAAQRVFVVDPIDGTKAFIDGSPECVVAIGLVEDSQAIAGVIYNPITEELFEGSPIGGSTLNGAPIAVSPRADLDGAALVGKESFFRASHWRDPWPPVRPIWRHAIAYRLCLIAHGAADGGLLLGYKHEWDIAGAVAILRGAGATVTDPWGAGLRFNQPDPRAPGVVAAGPALHPLLQERASHTPHPRDWPGATKAAAVTAKDTSS